MSHTTNLVSSPEAFLGLTVFGSDGEKIGKVKDVYEDSSSGASFASVSTGLFSGSSFVPLQEVSWQGDDLVLPYTKEFVKDAPRIESDAEISPAEEDQIFSYYSLSSQPQTAAASWSETGSADTSAAVGYDTSGPTTDDAMTRSEEQLHVGTETVAAGTARLRKYVVTENVTQTVPVTREEVRIEREPITDQNVGSALDGPAISAEEHEVVLHEERPVVAKEAVPVERVRLNTDTVTDTETVSDTIQKEEIETDVPTPAASSETGTFSDSAYADSPQGSLSRRPRTPSGALPVLSGAGSVCVPGALAHSRVVPAADHDDAFLARVVACVELLRDVVSMDRLLWMDGLPLPAVADERYPASSPEDAHLAVVLLTGPRFSFLVSQVGSDSWTDLMAAALALPGLGEDDLHRLATSFDVWAPRALPRFLARAAASVPALAEAFHGLRSDRHSFPHWDDPDALDRLLATSSAPMVRAAAVFVTYGQLFYSDLERLLKYSSVLSLPAVETLESLVKDAEAELFAASTPMARAGIFDRYVVLAHACN